jgi:hypothetical protein
VGDPRQLVYIACHRSGEYFVELETAPAAGAELPYATAGRFEAVDRETLLGIIARHLSLEVHEKRRRSG